LIVERNFECFHILSVSGLRSEFTVLWAIKGMGL
jgi:hypothetical protein